MILNKSAYERGFGHGCVYKSFVKELNEVSGGSSQAKSRFRMINNQKHREDRKIDLSEKGLDPDGLPYIEKKLEHGSAELCIYDTVLGKPKYTSFKDTESARIESIKLMGDEKGLPSNVNIGYTIRY